MKHSIMTAIVLSAFSFFSFSANAQETDLINGDQQATNRPSDKSFKKKLSSFIASFSDFDTMYVTPNFYTFSLMSIYYNNVQNYSIRSSHPKRQRLDFTPRPHNKIGFYMGWQFLFLGFSFNTKDLFHCKEDKSMGSQFELSLYTSKVGIDLLHVTSGNNFRIHRIQGFALDKAPYFSKEFNGLKVDTKSIYVYYIFNNRRFSYPAAFNQSTVQRISTGSFISGLSVSSENFEFDFSKLPIYIQNNMDPDMKLENVKYKSISLSFGYSYNWVFARNCLANISFSPVLSYRTSHIKNVDHQKTIWHNKLNIDYLIRAGVVYNTGKFFIGTSFLGRSFVYKQRDFYMNNGFGTLQIYAGFNFALKKQYRKKQNTE